MHKAPLCRLGSGARQRNHTRKADMRHPRSIHDGRRLGAQPPHANHRGAIAIEAAICLPVIVALMFGMWELGRVAQMSRIMKDAAREGARVAAGGTNNGTTVSVSDVQNAVRNFLTASGIPSTAASAAAVTVTNLSANSWTDPGDARPLDHFRVTVTISGAAYASLQLSAFSLTGITQLQESVDWYSANDAQVVVSTTLPY
jgi:Flp pilus assembly protein TadG